VLQVGTALWTFRDGPTVRAQLAYELVELPVRSSGDVRLFDITSLMV
jgi:hypothetical protein